MAANWHYAKGGKKHGPITAAQLKELATTGQLSPDDLVWREDMKEWRKASTVKGLFSEQSSVSPAPPPPPTSRTNSTGETPLWERPAILALLVICCFPVGLFLLWKNPRISSKQKMIWTGAFGVLMVVGMILSLTQGKNGGSAGSPQQTASTGGSTARVLHEPYTHVLMPDIRDARVHSISFDELLALYKAQPGLRHAVKDIDDVSFTEGPDGEPIERYVAVREDGTTSMLAHFYRNDSGEAVFHGQFRQFHPNGEVMNDNLFVSGTVKCRSRLNPNGTPRSLEFYDGDGKQRTYSFRYHSNGKLSQMETHRVIHVDGENGVENIRFAQDGLKIEFDEFGDVWRETIWGNLSPTNEPSASKIFGSRFKTAGGETQRQGVMEPVDPRDAIVLQRALETIKNAGGR